MTDRREKIKEFFEEKSEEISSKIEKTPMEKFFVFFLILITISALVLGYLQFKKNLEEPLYPSYLHNIRSDLRNKYKVSATNQARPEEEVIKLQNQDSDLDGLDDYSEIYIYQTSPYLEDSDSDGIWDKQEILAGTDPNCPEGEDCTAQQFEEEAAGTSLNQNMNGPANEITDLIDTYSSEDMNLEAMGIYDQDFQQMLEEFSSGESIGTETTEQLSPEAKELTIEELKNLTPAQIREELEKSGIDKNLLDQIDDQTLKNTFLEILNSY